MESHMKCFFPKEFTFDQPWGIDDFRLHLPDKCSELKQPNYCLNVQRVIHMKEVIKLIMLLVMDIKICNFFLIRELQELFL